MKLCRNSVIQAVIGILGAILEVKPAWSQSGGVAVQPPVAQERPSNLSPGSPASSSGGANAILEKAILRLETCDSISAKTRQSADLFGKRLVGTGSYKEMRSPRGLMFRLELKFQLGDETATLLQTCDGIHLWIDEDFRGKSSVARIDVLRVARELEAAGDSSPPVGIAQRPGLGGLPRLVRGLHLAFDFTAAHEARLEERLPVIRLQGQWKPAKLAQILPARAEEIRAGKTIDLGKLPPHLPHYVVIFLEQKGLFPRRIEYWRREPITSRQQDAPESQLMVAMDLFDVQINVPVSPTSFQFDPGKKSVSNQTDRYLQESGLKKRE